MSENLVRPIRAAGVAEGRALIQAPAPRERSRYAAAGVDIDAGAALVRAIDAEVRSTARPGVMGGLGGFGALFDLAACGLRDPILVAATDGVGTKVLLGLEADRLEGLGIDLVAMCVNDLVVQGAAPLFFLDYYATGRLDVTAAARVVAGIAAGCREAGCALVGGETAEMPGLYRGREFDLAGFAVGAVEREALLPRTGAIAAGDVLLGLASSGLHSNGFSLVRKVLQDSGIKLDAPAPFAPQATIAAAALAPTRIYVRACLDAVAAGGVKALAHITGGGLVENLPRVLPDGAIAALDATAWPLPPVLAWLAEVGALGADELARTFNCGIGMVLVVTADRADATRSALEAAGETVAVIGRVEPGAGPPRVELRHTEQAWPSAASPS